MDREQMPGFNDIIIGHPTICEAARLISDSQPIVPHQQDDRSIQRILRLLELCALVEAVVLHDKLFTLPGNLPNDIENLKLRNRLVNMGILQEFPPSVLSKDLIPVFTKWLKNTKARNFADAEFNIEFDAKFDAEFRDALASDFRKPYMKARLNSAFYEASGLSKIDEMSELIEKTLIDHQFQVLQNDTFFGREGALNDMSFSIVLQIFGSGSYESSASTLRSMLYWQVADRIGLPWYPDVVRVPLMLTLTRPNPQTNGNHW